MTVKLSRAKGDQIVCNLNDEKVHQHFYPEHAGKMIHGTIQRIELYLDTREDFNVRNLGIGIKLKTGNIVRAQLSKIYPLDCLINELCRILKTEHLTDMLRRDVIVVFHEEGYVAGIGVETKTDYYHTGIAMYLFHDPLYINT